MAIRARTDVDQLADEFERALVRARRRAGRRVGTRIKRAHVQHLRQLFGHPVSKGRKKQIQRVVPTGPTENGGNLSLYDNWRGAVSWEEGATIRPKSGQYLALRSQLDYAGSRADAMPGRAGQFNRVGGGGRVDLQEYRDRGETFVIESENGNPVVMRSTKRISRQRRILVRKEVGKGATAFPVATLVRSVHIPAHLDFRARVKRYLDQYVDEVEDEVVFKT